MPAITQWEYSLASLAVVAQRSSPLDQRLGDALTTIEGELDELGADGWEAVGPVTVSSLHGNDEKFATVLLLKRPVRPEPEDAVPYA